MSALESPLTPPSKPSATGIPTSDRLTSQVSLRGRSSKSRLGSASGGLSDPEDYSSAVAAAVASIIASAKAEDLKEQDDLYRLDDVSLDTPRTEPTEPLSVSKNKTKKGGKKSKSKLLRSKSKTKQVPPLRRAATTKAPSRQESFGSLAITLHNAVSHAGSAKVPAPTLLPKSPNVMDLSLYLARIQQYFNQLSYHRQGEPKIRVLTNMSVKHQIETARSLIKAGEPIKCLHALVLAIHLTNCSYHIERFPINFKSDFNGKEYKHVVLGVYLYGLFGALGISRDPGLQDKPIAYPRLLDLIMDYQRCYSESGHILREVKIGGVITHDPHSCEPINWRIGSVLVEDLNPNGLEVTFEKISKQLRSKMGATCLRNVRPTQMVFPSSGEQPISPTATPPRVLQAKKSKTVAALNAALKKGNKK